METIAPGVDLIQLGPGYRFNAYLLDDVLVDTGTRWHINKLSSALKERNLREVILTHAHPDHQGCAHRICCEMDVPLGCPTADADAMEGSRPLPPHHPVSKMVVTCFGGLAHPVSRRLNDGDSVGEFHVIHAPGHTEGHSILFREHDGVLIGGDVLANVNFATGAVGLREPPHVFSTDWRQNRDSIRKMLDLQPSVICFGHGPPLKDLQYLRNFCKKLEANVHTAPR